MVYYRPRQKKNIVSATTGTSLKNGLPYNVNNPFGGQTQEQFIGEQTAKDIRKRTNLPSTSLERQASTIGLNTPTKSNNLGGYRSENIFNVNDPLPSQIARQRELQNIGSQALSQYYTPEQAQQLISDNNALKNVVKSEIKQGYDDAELDGNRTTYLYNKVLLGLGRVGAGLGEFAMKSASYVNPTVPQATDIAIKDYRENIAPNIRNYLKETIGVTTDKRLENKYNDETFTSAIGGLAESAPAIAATIVNPTFGTASMGAQMFDGAIESINSTPEGRSLDETTKTLFAGGVAAVQTLLEKYALDKILKSQSGIVSDLVAKQALKQAIRQTNGNVTGDVFSRLLNKEVLNLSNKFAIGGARALDAALVEYTTEAAQEGTSIAGELLVNKNTGKSVFNTKNIDSWDGFVDNIKRVNKAGISGLIAGGVLGGASSLFNINRNKIEQTQQQLNDIDTNLANENISEETKSLLVARRIKLQEELDAASKKIDEGYNNLSESQQERVNEIVEQQLNLQSVINDPSITPELRSELEKESEQLNKEMSDVSKIEDKKLALEESKKQLEKEIEPIKPEEQITFDYETIDDVPDSLKDRVVETDGKLSITMPKSEADALQKNIDVGVRSSDAEQDLTKLNKDNLEDINNPIHQKSETQVEELTKESKKNNSNKIYEIQEKPKDLKDIRSVLSDYKIDKDFDFILDTFKDVGVSFDGKHMGSLPVVASLDSAIINNKLSNIFTINKKTFDKLSNEKKKEVISHEMVHGLIRLKLNEKGDIKGSSFYNGLNKIFDEVKSLYYSGERGSDKKSVDFLRKNFTENELNDLGGKIRYIEKEIEEFATLGLTDPTVSKLLKSMKADSGNSNSTLWSKLAEIISKFIGVSNTKFNELLNFLSTELDVNKNEKVSSNKIKEIQEKRQLIKDSIRSKLKSQRSNLSSGFDPTLIKDFIDLGATYIEEGITRTSDLIKRFREDYKELGFDDSKITDKEISDMIFLNKETDKEINANTDTDILTNVPKTSNLSAQEVNDLNSELESDDITVNDIVDYEKSNATTELVEQTENVPEAVQKRSDDRKGDAGKNKVGEGVSAEERKAKQETTPEPEQSNQAIGEDEIADFNSLLNQKLPSRETRETRSNVERETGDRLAQEIKEFQGVDFKASMEYGDRLVQAAKTQYSNEYVTKLTDKVKKSDMSIDKKAVILQSIENDLRRQLLADPTNAKLKKQVNLATKETISYLQETARATAVGIFRQAARANYNIQEAADAIFSTKENQDRNKVEEAVFSTSEDIQKEYENLQKDGGIDATIEAAIQEGVERRLNDLYESLPSRRRQQADKAIKALDNIQKRLRSKTYESSIGLPVAIIDAGISTIKAAIKAGVAVADAVELGISKIKEQYGKKWDKEEQFRRDMLDGFKQEGVDTVRQRAQQDNLKQALIAAGYGKEITVRTKNGRETREILDWKKLTGEEGSFETLRENLAKLKDKGFSDAEIADLQAQLEEEYNDIHASIIEKSLNELNRRNAPKEGKQKILARRLAELYNLGVYDQDIDTYQNVLNNALGFSTQSQEAFNEIRKLNESLARLLDSRDDKGNKFSDVALASLETQIKNQISRVIQKAQFAEGNGVFKASVILKNVFSAMQRMMLASVGQLIENPFSGKLNDLHVALQDAFKKGKWDTKELAQHRRQLANVMYKDAALYSGGEYGGVGNPFTSKNAIEDFVNGISDTDSFKKVAGAKNLKKFKAMYQAMIGLLSGRQYLDAMDSYFKIKRTEKEFTHNLLRILTDKTNPNGAMKQEDALQYVSEIITGQTFTEAKDTARRIINNINEQAGKELLRPSETNVIRVANDLVKDNLVNGQKVTAQQVESAFKAAYKTAGKSIGHESNNIITDALSSFSQTTEQKLKDALKKKDWSTAALLNMTNTLVKNVAFPFVGGGTNWTVIGLQKMGVPTEWFRSDVGFSKKPIDLSTKEGSKELEKALAANATRQRMYARNLIGSITALSAILAMRALGDEDEYEKWLKKHKETAKLINKLQPVPLTLYMSIDEGDDKMTDAMLEVIGRRKNYDNFKLKRATENFYDGYRNGKKQKVSKAWGELGEIVGRRFNVPYLQSVRNIWTTSAKIEKEFTGTYKKEEKPSKSNGFVDGYFKGGMAEFLGITNDDKK